MTETPAAAANAAPAGWDCHVHVFDGRAPVHPGHYQPGHRPLQQIEDQAAAFGVGHLVLVQPSVYGSNNRLLLQALAARPGRHRGVVVADPAVTDAELQAWHALGVRGLRFNLVSPAGNHNNPQQDVMDLAPRLRALGWHVQWYAKPEHLAPLAAWQRACGLPFVLDHLAGLHAGLAQDDPAWQAAAALAANGAWLKLSGWYRLGAPQAPYGALLPTLRRAVALFGSRCVWGSDWPHTHFANDALPAYADQFGPVQAACASTHPATALARQAQALYGSGVAPA
ncbi:putative TIM-barrel fold metal-dependent hydrolase [Burkholderiales bacterium JOSHI_001]|nr:putative TIM-barrel fold metal-dependent hydrolase [Burkholderiales bacterium JOSHI_001]